MNAIQSVYIHIPFCQQICYYCDFTKFFYNEKRANDYLVALKNEISTYVDDTGNKVKTVFIGGGTPTALSVNQLESLLSFIDKKFDMTQCEEYTIEANPGDFNDEKVKLLKTYGVNRVSLGVQVFDDHMLKELGRLHKVKDVYETVELLQNNGITNISTDLIYALPNQTIDHFKNSLNQAMALGLPHLSTYALQIEPKTVFFQRHKKGKLQRPAQEEEVEMYHILTDTTKKHGLLQYEISNFAKAGFESKHNLTYWDNNYYYGFGAGAYGYIPGKRYGNIRPLPAYIKQAMADGKPVLHIDQINNKEQIEEEMFLGLRKMQGVNKQTFASRFGFFPDKLYKSSIESLVQKGWLQEDDMSIRLTSEGKLLANEVFERFLLEDSVQI
ncbi:MAG: radical SAM family heme chaperone HemW [Bacillota bacterium]|uniref:Heme chaperone HemW n=1 Tax=Virgibacillus salarius TaxID=447199 RepID=A0A941IBV4_9BACI|nr:MULTISPECIES: radical SAM family heme chaperone HemW [Bacillaceae]NAZ10891.1 oxygen-independent coproporphyrinogen III oxidase [Agaribacter marinus]MBR7798183.1 oxygen-independent coproporphyrinogen III oxidase [Virgibacillus salarius]MCC2252271.1 radical SAM family heme chaperone HemW [Virgibacillus sp. AGTR]MDY7046342.1 radical SAM family heme chaperone HemW [Virgibacillus sp. M23]QRZ17466.1 oxygen-independent coproporphyrinogen III oxidase [Virgibacillus sp. AGTR]